MAKNQTLQHKRSSVPGNQPTASQVATGELAINFADKSIYTKNTTNGIIELARDVFKATTAPTSPQPGDLWFNTTTGTYSEWDGTSWVNPAYTGSTTLPGNTAFSVTPTGLGTQASPYVFSTTFTSGQILLVSTVTITGLTPGQYVPIIDNSASSNGGRYYATNNIVDDLGTLRFNIMFKDLPATTGSASYSAAFVVGTGTVYITVDATLTIPFPQSVNGPTNTQSASTAWTAPNDTLTSTGSLQISKDNSTFNTGPLSIVTGDTLYLKWSGAPGSGTGIDGAHGSTITGAVVASGGGSSSFSLTIDKVPAVMTFTTQTGVGLNSTIQSNTVTVTGINSYAYITSANAMTASVNGATFTTIPASGSTLFAISGQTLVVTQTSSAVSLTTTTVTFQVGDGSNTFQVTTGDNSVNTPTIVTPIDNSTGIATTVTITSSAYQSIVAHASSDWELATNSGFSPLVLSTTITGWIPRTSGTTQQLHGSAWSGTQWVVVGGNGTVLTSPDGITWTARSAAGSTEFFTGLAWGNSQFVIASDSIFTSPDGITWTQRVSSGTFASMSGVAWGNNQWVAVGNNRTIITSTDGIIWTSRYTDTGGYLEEVAWSGSIWVAVGYDASFDGFIITSPDGINWTPQTVPVSIGIVPGLKPRISGITWGGGQFVTIGGRPWAGGSSPQGPSAILTSPDGINWTYRVGTGDSRLDDITWAGTKYVAIGDSGLTITSADGITWTNTGQGATTATYTISWNGTQLLAGGNNGAIVTASDANVAPNLTSWRPDSLSAATDYWVRVRYRSTDPLVSGWSPGSKFTTQ